MSQQKPTPAQAAAYAENYILYGDQTRAFRVAFPDSESTSETTHTKASKLNKLTQVQTRIKELREILKKQSEEEFTLSVSDLKEKLSDVIDKGLADKKIVVDGLILEGGPESLAATVSAIAEVNKMDGNHAAVRLAHGGGDTPIVVDMKASMTVEELEAECKRRGLPMVNLDE
jgi:hypothetical protein